MVAPNTFMVQQLTLLKHTILMEGNIWPARIKISVSGKVKSLFALYCIFDVNSLISISNQNRQERGVCQICWTITADGDFELSGVLLGAAGNYNTLKAKLECEGQKQP
jgi:hypothetical protein